MITTKPKIKYSTIYYLLIIISLFLTSCKTSQITKAHKKEFKKIYVDEFKLTYLRSLFIKSYNNSTEIQNLIKLDKSGFTEPLLTKYDYKIIDSLTTIDDTKLITDSTNSIGKVAEGAEGKHILDYIIKKMSGKWLDSLAQKRFTYAKD